MKESSLNNQLTWFKTGWFYLWLLIFMVIWITSKSHQFDTLDKYNLSLIKQIELSSSSAPNINEIEMAFAHKPSLNEVTAIHSRDVNYLLKSSGVLLSEISFCFLAVWLLTLTANKSLVFRMMLVISLMLSSLVTQWFLLKLSVWFSVTFVNLILLFSVSIIYLFHQELALFLKQNTKINHLLEFSAINLYRELSFEPVIPMIEQCQYPTEKLIENIQEVAILAEDDKNNQLAKRLHIWIISHQPRNLISTERLALIKQIEKEDAIEDELESTLVIERDGDDIQENTSGRSELLNIKSFGRYKTEGILGKGAMGIVFQGVDPKINRHVAIKTLFLHDSFSSKLVQGESEKSEHQSAIERFFREAETAGNLSHANIVTIYDVGEQELESTTGTQTLGYIAMDLLDGLALNEFTKKKNLLAPHLVYQLMIQMADALEYAHQSNIVHRDIKPANIIYNETTKKATLTDFGIAYIVDHSKTKTGTIMGSPYYMSPEQVIGSKVDGRSDIFSLGVTFYQLLTGELPFHGESIASVAFHITNTKHQSVRNHLSKLPSSAARITNKALQKNESKRYQSMKEFKQALINALKKDYKKQPL